MVCRLAVNVQGPCNTQYRTSVDPAALSSLVSLSSALSALEISSVIVSPGLTRARRSTARLNALTSIVTYTGGLLPLALPRCSGSIRGPSGFVGHGG